MDDVPTVPDQNEIATAETEVASPEIDAASQPYIGRWNQLVSNTNWEKGRIIFQWRDALVEAGAPATEYSDEAWARRVGGVTSQHVGRLRRVSQRFGTKYGDFEGLYWSHFQAALDWEDAEMWLEGATRSKWSVSQMRRTRWETMGAVATQEPLDEEIVTSELDEDFESTETKPAANSTEPLQSSYSEVSAGPLPEGPDFGDEEPAGAQATPPSSASDEAGAAIYADDNSQEAIDFIRPFANLATLPDDLSEAFDSYKLAILRHKSDGWSQISRDDVLASLEALKQLVDAPSADSSPF